MVEIKKVSTGEVIGTVKGDSLSGAMLNGQDLPGADFSGKSMTDAELRRANLRGANFDKAWLEHATFEGADLQGASFRNAYLERANFSDCDLRQADLTGATLSRTTFLGVRHDSGTKWPEGFDLMAYAGEMAAAEDEMIRRFGKRS